MTIQTPGKLLLPFLTGCVMAIHSLCAAAQTPADLARRNACMACHGLVHKQVGPGFAQIAERYRGDAEAAARLAGKIRDGSVGTWGRVIMPGSPRSRRPMRSCCRSGSCRSPHRAEAIRGFGLARSVTK